MLALLLFMKSWPVDETVDFRTRRTTTHYRTGSGSDPPLGYHQPRAKDHLSGAAVLARSYRFLFCSEQSTPSGSLIQILRYGLRAGEHFISGGV